MVDYGQHFGGPQQYGNNDCAYALYGVCLEPDACEMEHKQEQRSFDQSMSTSSQAFNPNLTTDSPAFDPNAFVPSYDQPQMSERQGLIEALKGHGLDLEVEAELGLIFIKQFDDCSCCHGNVLLCEGEQCANLGMCVCVYSYINEKQFEQDMKMK